MILRVLGAVSILLLAACSKVTQENYDRIRAGMTPQEVEAILGSPTESSSSGVLGLTETSSKWVGNDTVITVRFVNGRVALRTFDKGARQ